MEPARLVSPTRAGSKVSVDEIYVVRPSEPLNRSTIFLSNIDQKYGFFVKNLFFFRDNPGTQSVVERLQEALSKTLVAYPGCAGRLAINPVTNKIEVDCNSAGALLASATSNLSIHDVGDGNYGDFFLSPTEACTLEDLPLLTIQVTHLGGDNAYAISVLISHMLVDATAGIIFLLNLASVSRGEGLYQAPNWDRTGLRARDPPKIEFEHREFTSIAENNNTRFTVSIDSILAAERYWRDIPKQKRKVFHFGFDRLNELKKLVTDDGLVSRTSSFEALAALMWRAHANTMVRFESYPSEKVLNFSFAMDIRSILQLGSNFMGNAQLAVNVEMKLEDMCKLPLSHIVLSIQESRKKATEEYVRSGIDYLEMHPDHWYKCDSKINCWPRIMCKAIELDLGWGKPARVEFPVSPRNSVLVFFPFDANGDVDGFYVHVGLDPSQLPTFEEHITFSA